MIAVTAFHLRIIFAAALAIFAVMSVILFYHWWRYRFGNSGVIIAGVIYLAVSVLLIILAWSYLP